MTRKQYIVTVKGPNNRKEFIEYIINNYKRIKVLENINDMINSTFPFVVDLKRKELWVCDSITCLAQASSSGLIINKDDFKLL